jgi:hypothetical protein
MSATDGSPKKKLQTTTVTHMKQSKKQKVTAKKSTRSKTMTFSMKRYNNYNIFFMLERQRLLQSRQGDMAITIGGDAATATADVTPAVDSVEVSNHPRPSNNDITEENLLPPGAVRGYNNLVLPALCRRYADLPLSRNNWFEELLAIRGSKRRHCKSHGLISFTNKLARIIAANYREVDDETKAFVNEVALRIGLYNHDLEESKEMKECEDRMGLTQEQMKAQQRQEMEVGKKTSLKNDNPSKNSKARGAGAMSTMMMTQLPPPLAHSTTMIPRTLTVHSTTMMPRTLTASALPSPMVSYDFELARLRREAEMATFARIKLEHRITQLQMQHYHQLRVQEQLRASREHAELVLHILHRRENHMLTMSNNSGIMSNIMGRVVPSGTSFL